MRPGQQRSAEYVRLSVGDLHSRRACCTRLVVLLDAEDDDPARSIGHRCHIASEVPLLAVAAPVEAPLKVEVERFLRI